VKRHISVAAKMFLPPVSEVWVDRNRRTNRALVRFECPGTA